MNIRSSLIALLALAASTIAVADKVVLNPRHPDRYVVSSNDTLWDIAGKFLKDPWQWPDLWTAGDKAARPLHPGDVLTLTQQGGKPRLQLNITAPPVGEDRGEGARRRHELPVVKLLPNIRATAINEEIPVIPLNAVRAFLVSPKVVSEDELDNAPYLLELADQRVLAGAGEKVYVRGLADASQSAYGLFHKGSAYRDGISGEELGYEAMHVGDVSLVQEGDPAIFMLTRTQLEAKAGDRLLALDEERIPTHYEPHAPGFDLKGHIISVYGTIPTASSSQSLRQVTSHGVPGQPHIGRFAVVAVDRGSNDGIEAGHVLDIYQAGLTVADRVGGKPYDKARLPDEIVGSLLIFRTFERVSYGLVMKASIPLHVGAVVKTPTSP